MCHLTRRRGSNGASSSHNAPGPEISRCNNQTVSVGIDFRRGRREGTAYFFHNHQFSPLRLWPGGGNFPPFSQLTNNWRLPSAQLDWRTFRNGLSVGNETSIGSGGLQLQSFRQLASVSVDGLRLPSGGCEGTLPRLRKPNIEKTHPKSIRRGGERFRALTDDGGLFNWIARPRFPSFEGHRNQQIGHSIGRYSHG
jgi:hypothetical protein